MTCCPPQFYLKKTMHRLTYPDFGYCGDRKIRVPDFCPLKMNFQLQTPRKHLYNLLLPTLNLQKRKKRSKTKNQPRIQFLS